MELMSSIQKLSDKANTHNKTFETEEATKHALILPFIQLLGYNVFDTMEVIPEFTADVGTKKGEKVDYAIKHDDDVAMLIECKAYGSELKIENASQLYRYFSVTEARFAVLTNGIRYRFYTDIDRENIMDSKPFFEFNLLRHDEGDVEQLNKFSKESFNVDKIVSSASNLKYMSSIKMILMEEMSQPSDDFVRYFTSKVYSGRITQTVKEQFTKIVKYALNEFIRDKVKDRLNNALASQNDTEEQEEDEFDDSQNSNIETTQEEIDAFNIVRAVLHEIVPLDRVVMRDTQSYCGVLLDNNNRKPICRLRFNGNKKYLGVFTGKSEEKISINTLNDIFQHASKLKSAVEEYENLKVA